jgi:hypothetical protein
MAMVISKILGTSEKETNMTKLQEIQIKVV